MLDIPKNNLLNVKNDDATVQNTNESRNNLGHLEKLNEISAQIFND